MHKLEAFILGIILILLVKPVINLITMDSQLNIERRLNENYVKVMYSDKLNKNIVVNYNFGNLFFFKKPSLNQALIFDNSTKEMILIKELEISLNDRINFVFIQSNWYINKESLSKISKEEAISFCKKIEDIINENQINEERKKLSWNHNLEGKLID